MGTSKEEKYWFNLRTGEVEHGLLSPSIDRAGPFETAEEAARALEIIRENTAAWDDEENDD